jgi:hypothetical protein
MTDLASATHPTPQEVSLRRPHLRLHESSGPHLAVVRGVQS